MLRVRRRLRLKCAQLALHLTRISNPKGIASSSPGLRSRSAGELPWENVREITTTPTGLRPIGLASVRLRPQPFQGCSHLGADYPRVALPLSGIATLGFEPESLWDSPFVASHSKNACKVQQSSAAFPPCGYPGRHCYGYRST